MKKTAIITGASRGIGYAIARQLGKDDFPFTTKIIETDNGYYKFI